MAEFDSVQFTDSLDFSKQVNPNTWGGRVRAAWFEQPATWDAAQNDTVRLVKLPDRARVIGGRVAHGAFGAGVTLDIGDAGSENRYLSALAVNAAGESDFADTIARNMGHIVDGNAASDQRVVKAKLEGANPAADIALEGYVLYMVD